MKTGTVRIISLSLLAGGLLAGLIWLIVSELEKPLFSPPDKERDWARVDYRETFAPVPALPLPTLTESPEPALKVTREATKLTIIYPEHDAPATRDQHEIFEPDASGSVVLPGGNRLRLDAIALVQNAEIDWGDKKYTERKVEWLDPVTLNPLPSDQTVDWPKQRLGKGYPASLLLRVSNSGEAPLRWFAARVFDNRTLARVQNSTSIDTYAKDHIFNIGLLIGHQTPVRIAVNFAFGEPEIRELSLEKDAAVRFGNDGLARVIDSYPMRSTSSSWGGDTDRLTRAEYDFASTRPDTKQRAVIFQVWPPHNQELIDFRVIAEGGGARNTPASGNEGLATLNLEDEFAEVKTVRVRRFPKFGRAVFEVPRLPGLPEVKDLLDAPIPRATFYYDNDFRRFIEKSAGLEWQAWRLRNLPKAAFPMTLEDFTPREALAIWEQQIGVPLYFDADTLSIRDEKPGPPGKLAELMAWWKRAKPRWLP